MKPSLPRLIAIILFVAAGQALAADVARVLLAAGDTVAIRDNQTIKLTFGSTIQDKDVLRTGPASNLQVRFIDESIVSMRENSELRIDEFSFTGKEDGSERAFFRLLKGGLRAISGLVGRTNHKNYALSSVTATIGIRGTDYAATLCQQDCRNPDGALAKDGLYGRVLGAASGTNRIAVTNDTGERIFGINENFYVADSKSVPQPLLEPPGFVSNRLEGRKQGGTTASSGGTGSEQATSGGAAAESRPSTTPEPLPQIQYVASQNLGPQGTPAVLPPANGFVVVYPLPIVAPLGEVVFDDRTPATFNNLNQLTAYGIAGIFPAGSLNGGSITDTGSLTLSNGQTFAWGRWTGNTIITLSNGTTFTGAPVLFGTASGLTNNSVIGSLGGVATYTYAGGPRPVDAGGNVGSITSTSATINFTAQTAFLSLMIDFPSIVAPGVPTARAFFDVRGTGFRSNFPNSGEFIGLLSGTCTGGGCFLPGFASGFFDVGLTGPNGFDFAAFGGVIIETNAGDVAFLNAYLASSFTAGTPAAPAKVMQFVFASGPSVIGSGSVVDSGTGTLTLSPPLLTAYSTVSPSGPQSGNLSAGSVVESTPSASAAVQANAAAAGNIQWGRWTGAFQVVNGGQTLTPGSGLHYIYGDIAGMLPTSGSAIYSYIGGTNPTNSSGQIGTFTGGAFNVNFVTQTLTVSTPLMFTMPGGFSYSLNTCTGCTYSSPQASFINIGATLSGQCTGGGCSVGVPASGGVNGFFTGTTGQGLITSSTISAAGTPGVATFVAGFKR